MSILNTMSDIVFSVYVDNGGTWRFSMANNRFLEATGLDLEQVLERRVSEVIAPQNYDRAIEKFGQALGSNKPVQWEEMSRLPGMRLVHVTVVTAKDGVGGYSSNTLIGWMHDASECLRRTAEIMGWDECLLLRWRTT